MGITGILVSAVGGVKVGGMDQCKLDAIFPYSLVQSDPYSKDRMLFVVSLFYRMANMSAAV